MAKILTSFLLNFLFSFVNSQWGYGNGGYGGNSYGNYGGPQIPNNNVGIGYPTAYGLWMGRGAQNNNGWGDNYGGGGGVHPSQGTGFGSPLRCLNGGAHIGQCRLDQDSICIALGGTCIHGACCTTPFVGLLTTSTATPLIDGEVTQRASTVRPPTRLDSESSEEQDVEIEHEKTDKIDESEIEEYNRLVNLAKSTTKTRISVTLAPEALSDTKQCSSGLRAVGPCGDDDDCPSLHICEANKCCYIV